MRKKDSSMMHIGNDDFLDSDETSVDSMVISVASILVISSEIFLVDSADDQEKDDLREEMIYKLVSALILMKPI